MAFCVNPILRSPGCAHITRTDDLRVLPQEDLDLLGNGLFLAGALGRVVVGR